MVCLVLCISATFMYPTSPDWSFFTLRVSFKRYMFLPHVDDFPSKFPNFCTASSQRPYNFKAVWLKLKFFSSESNNNTCWFIRSDTDPIHSCSKFLMISTTLVHNNFADLTTLPISPPPLLPDSKVRFMVDKTKKLSRKRKLLVGWSSVPWK